jgi:hypothetical protein
MVDLHNDKKSITSTSKHLKVPNHLTKNSLNIQTKDIGLDMFLKLGYTQSFHERKVYHTPSKYKSRVATTSKRIKSIISPTHTINVEFKCSGSVLTPRKY